LEVHPLRSYRVYSGVASVMGIVKLSIELKGAFPSMKSLMPDILMMAGQEAQHEWHKLARNKLHGTAHAYISSISSPVYSRNKVTITLRSDTPEGMLANKLEQGCGPFDMKPGFLRSPKAKGKGADKYLTIPLRLKSYGSRGDSPPVMPSTIYKKAAALEVGQSMTLPKKYEGYGLRTRLSADLKRWDSYTWKTSPFQGITKVARWPNLIPLGTPRESAGMYMIFRRVSKKSSPDSWIHPGFKAINLIEQVESKLDNIFAKIVDNVLSAK